MKTLKDLYRDHQGKVTDKWASYLDHYDRVLSRYRDQPVTILEIGVQNGGSLELWGRYFHEARAIVGCDINPACANLVYDDHRIALVVGDANDDAQYSKIMGVATSYDIIIDDGSHGSGDIVRSFARYFPVLNRGGIYITEDLHCSYWGAYHGGLYYPFSSISFFKRIIDVMNYEHWGVSGTSPLDVMRGMAEVYGAQFDNNLASEVYAVEFVNSCVFIQKADKLINELGERVVVGSVASIMPEPVLFRGHNERVPVQDSNKWSTLERAPDEEWEALKIELDSCRNRLTAMEQSASWRITRPLRAVVSCLRAGYSHWCRK